MTEDCWLRRLPPSSPCCCRAGRLWARWRHGLLAAGVAAIVAGCATVSSESDALRSDLDDLQQQHEAEVVRLDQVRHEVLVAQATLEAHDARIAWAECTAARKDVEAVVAARRAECMLRLAQHSGCLAANAHGALDNEVTGGLLGLLAAVVTGGAAAPFVLGGAVAGRAVSSSDEGACGVIPDCAATTDDQRTREALADRGLDEMPACDDLLHAACVGEHLLFLAGQLETVVIDCLDDREAECEAETRLVDIGVLPTSDCAGADVAPDEGPGPERLDVP